MWGLRCRGAGWAALAAIAPEAGGKVKKDTGGFPRGEPRTIIAAPGRRKGPRSMSTLLPDQPATVDRSFAMPAGWEAHRAAGGRLASGKGLLGVLRGTCDLDLDVHSVVLASSAAGHVEDTRRELASRVELVVQVLGQAGLKVPDLMASREEKPVRPSDPHADGQLIDRVVRLRHQLQDSARMAPLADDALPAGPVSILMSHSDDLGLDD